MITLVYLIRWSISAAQFQNGQLADLDLATATEGNPESGAQQAPTTQHALACLHVYIYIYTSL